MKKMPKALVEKVTVLYGVHVACPVEWTRQEWISVLLAAASRIAEPQFRGVRHRITLSIADRFAVRQLAKLLAEPASGRNHTGRKSSMKTGKSRQRKVAP